MIQQQAEVLTYKKVGEEYHSLTFVAPEIAEAARPGQFVNLRPPANRSYILRRPFSIYRVSRRAGAARTIEIVFDVRGPGTAALAALRPHDLVDVVGPVGRGFTLPKQQYSCLLVGGGIGAAPLFFLADELAIEGKRVDILWGGARASRLLNPIEAKRLGATAEFSTDDGSVGYEGLVTDLMPDLIARCGSEVVYTCGPDPMMATVTEIAVKHGIPVQVAMEQLMGCGIGICMTCVTPIWNKEGTDAGYARTCLDGPVFNGARVAWDGFPRSEPAVPAGN